jgi:hypothetical protein
MCSANDDRCGRLMRHLESGDLEAASSLGIGAGMRARCDRVDRLIDDLKRRETEQRSVGEVRAANRLKRRTDALVVFKDHGLDADRLLTRVRLPEGYEGKILLLVVMGGAADKRVLLRCGDEWHREILKDTEEEVSDLGFSGAVVEPLGGAWVRFDARGNIRIWGSSEEFGACDHHRAAEMIREFYPGRSVT